MRAYAGLTPVPHTLKLGTAYNVGAAPLSAPTNALLG